MASGLPPTTYPSKGNHTARIGIFERQAIKRGVGKESSSSYRKATEYSEIFIKIHRF